MTYSPRVRFPVLLALVLASVSLAAPKKKKVVPPPAPTPAANIALQVALKKTLDGAEQQVGACVLDNAPTGAFTLSAKAAISINHAGQLMGTTISFKPEPAAAEKIRKCMEAVMQGLTWPRSLAPLVSAEREWTFEVK